MTTGDVELTILDGGGSVVVPGASIQVVIGCSSAGTAAQVVATRNVNTLVTTFGYGPMVEAAALAILAGGTVLAIKATSNAAGAQTAVTAFATGTSVVTTTGTANDDYLVKMLIVTGGTRGTTGITFQISLDGGKTYGPVLALGTATTYLIPNTGITLNFGAGTMVAAESVQFSSTAPAWNTAGIQSCLNALQASQYAAVGWGSMHIVGVMSGANATTIQGYLNTLATGKIYTRAMVAARDALIPIAWGGAGETEATWTTSVTADYAAVDAKRIDAHSGHYNTPSAIPNSAAGAPRYRRSLAWSAAARQVAIPPQRHAGRVKDGALSTIVIDSSVDPGDGFVYHDERLNPGFGAARFTAARTRIGLPGLYITDPKLMAALGSVFSLLPLGNVMDVACGIVNQIGQRDINADIRLNTNGTIYENEARAIEATMLQALNDNMTAKAMISSATVAVDRGNNVQTTSTVNVAVTIFARGYVLEEDITIGFGNAAAAGG